MCFFCKKYDFSIFVDHFIKCYCKEKDGKCVKCICFNISILIFVWDFFCKNFYFKVKKDCLIVEFYNSSVGLIEFYVGLENKVSFYLEEI